MKNLVLVDQSPDKGNIVLAVKNHVTLELSFMPFVNRMKEVRSNLIDIVIKAFWNIVKLLMCVGEIFCLETSAVIHIIW